MNTWKRFARVAVCSLAFGVACFWAVQADDPAKPEGQGDVVVIDSAGKEQKLKNWKMVAGTRRLSWLAPAAPEKKEDDKDEKKEAKPVGGVPAGPEALEVREENSTNFVNGILTLVPLEHLRSIEYDSDKQTVTVRVAKGEKPEQDEVLTGNTKFQKINKLVIEAEVDKGDMGVAELKFLGGVPRGMRGVRFASPKPVAAGEAGRPATVTVADKQQKTEHKVTDLQPLYRMADGSERLVPTLFFKKTLKVDVGKIDKMQQGESEDKEGSEWTVTLKDGSEQTLTMLRAVTIDGKQGTLEGLLGRVPSGYKLFPLHTANEVQFEKGKP